MSAACSGAPNPRRGGRIREIFLFHDPDAEPEEWRVEDIDPDGDGSVSVVIFSGFQAEQRAKRYADRLRTNTD